MKKNSLFLFDLSIVLLVLSFLNLSLGQAKPPQTRPQVAKSRSQVAKSRPQLAKKQKQVNQKKSFNKRSLIDLMQLILQDKIIIYLIVIALKHL